VDPSNGSAAAVRLERQSPAEVEDVCGDLARCGADAVGKVFGLVFVQHDDAPLVVGKV